MGAKELVYIHHEGAGGPSDVARGADGGYTYWIGATRFEWLRSADDSYATRSYNGASVDVCLSGDRHTAYPVTDGDLSLIEGALRDARARGYVIERPDVRPHRETSSTACPGDRTMSRWSEVEAAVWRGTGGGSGGAPPAGGDDEMPLNDADKDWIYRAVTDILRKEGVSGAASEAHRFSDEERADIQRIVVDCLRKEGVSGAAND